MPGSHSPGSHSPGGHPPGGHSSRIYSHRHPAEWEPHSACWLAFPRLPEEWPCVYEQVCQEFAQLCATIADIDPHNGLTRGEDLHILVFDAKIEALARQYLGPLPVHFHRLPYDDIWLRDTGPVFIQDNEEIKGLCFNFNVWGEKFEFPNDRKVGSSLCKQFNIPHEIIPWVLEGGALETDGQGTCLTTRQCLLNPNRNSNVTAKQIESQLKETLGYAKILWIEEGLINDHTDGHIDTLARFILPGIVMVMEAKTREDPNQAVLKSIANQLTTMKDAKGRSLQIVPIPSPGLVLDQQDQALPASYLNFYIANTTVIVPTYNSPFDQAALTTIQTCFPKRRVVGLSAQALITGGGAFHCITQQQP